MPPPKLTDLCTRACIKNVRSITNIGSFEYWQIRPILLRVDNPEQLHEIEINCPQIVGQTEELWRALIARDIPESLAIKGYAPKNPIQWYKVYLKYKKERDEAIKRDEETLRQTMMGIQKKRETNITQIVNMRSVKIPRDPRMPAHNGGVPITKNGGYKKETPSTLNFTTGSKTKTTDSRGVLLKARREASEIGKMTKLSRPTQDLHRNKVYRAPAGMVKEHQVAHQPQIKILTRRPSAIKELQSTSTATGLGRDLEEREARLRAMMQNTKRPNGEKETIINFSEEEEEEDDDDGDGDDLFDDSQKAPSKTKYYASSPPPRSSSTLPPQKAKPSNILHNPSRGRPMSSSTAQSSSQRSKAVASSSRSRPVATSSSPPPARTGTPPVRRSSPGPASGPLKPMIVRKRPVVDIFNRGAKKPRRA